ncbi:hypothetical protein [Scytonema hofmannii]|uniref:hypothetical protein n=1 Tax=Scytonema hofmannii TaxID=34078 RepID=UPI00034626E6|nr:hypothetical protein [Scytonema hofmannii]
MFHKSESLRSQLANSIVEELQKINYGIGWDCQPTHLSSILFLVMSHDLSLIRQQHE